MGIGYIEFTSIAYISLAHISISVPYKETNEDIWVISIHKLIHEMPAVYELISQTFNNLLA